MTPDEANKILLNYLSLPEARDHASLADAIREILTVNSIQRASLTSARRQLQRCQADRASIHLRLRSLSQKTQPPTESQ